MTRRECQSCRHFQAAGFDSMGWCTHPKRRIGSEVRIFVRAHELPCRNDWAKDLWQADGPAPSDVVLETVALPMMPATADELSAVAAAASRSDPGPTAANMVARGEDIVVGEVTSSIAAGEISQAGHKRQTIRRAHEEVKTRRREQRSHVSPLADDDGLLDIVESAAWPALESRSSPAAGLTGERDGGRAAAAALNGGGDVPPVALGEIGRHFPTMTTFPDDEERFSSIPVPVKGFELPLAKREGNSRVVGRAGFDDEHALLPWPPEPELPPVTNALEDLPPFEEVPRVDLAPGVAQPRRRRLLHRQRPRPVQERSLVGENLLAELYSEPELAPYLAAAERADGAGQSVPSRASSLPREESESYDELAAMIRGVEAIGDDRLVPAEFEPPSEPRHRDRAARRVNGPTAPRDGTLFSADVEIDPLDGRHSAIDGDAEVDDYVVMPGTIDEEINAAEPERWSAIPRMCRTCRDFRPAENGERGWCTNKWAFSHRRMVDADELPCETSIGGWWLPHDDSWMSVVDVTAHSQPTPLLDHWMALRAAANGDRDADAPMRRRQR